MNALEKGAGTGVILGAGDVVMQRLLPALFNRKVFDNVHIFHTGIVRDSPVLDMQRQHISLSLMHNDWLDRIAPDSPIIIATPPAPRLGLTLQALNAGRRVVVEKPLTMAEPELPRFRQLLAQNAKLFGLSYYALEKALGWSWLNLGIADWRPYLVAPGDIPLERLRDEFLSLGEPESIEIDLCESIGGAPSEEAPFWFQHERFGVWFDMGVHVVMMMLIHSQKTKKYAIKASQLAADQYRIEGLSGATAIKINFGKAFADERCKRELTATFREGRVICNFDASETTLETSRLKKTTLRLALGNQKYHTLAKQINRFISSGALFSSNPRSDLMDIQIDAIQFLHDLMQHIDRKSPVLGNH